MNKFLEFLKSAFSRELPKDRITGHNRHADFKTGLRNLRPFINRHWRKGFYGVLIVIIATLLGFPAPLITRYLIDNVIIGKQVGLLAGAIFLLLVIVLAERLGLLVQQFYFARFEQQVMLDIQENLIDRTLHFPKSFFDDNQTGYLMSRLASDVSGIRWFFSTTIVYIISNVLRFLGGLIFLFYLEWRLAFAILILLPMLLVCVNYFAHKTYVLSHRSMEQQAHVTSRFQESLSAVSLIKSFSSEARAVSSIISELKKAFKISLDQITVNSLANLVVNLFPGLARTLVLAFGAYWVIKGDWTLGSLVAFQFYLGYVFGPVQFLAAANLQMQDARAALDRVSALFDIVPEENVGTGKIVERLRGEIEAKNISFSYDSRELVLEGLNFHVQAGEHVAIVGPSGIGKTTLLSLILRLYKPTAGELYFDGRPASEYELGALRQRIGYVSQNTVLLSGTIKENICYGKPGADNEQVVRAAKIAGIDKFINNLPNGYDTEIGERGVKLSEGQKQRLAIARALVKDPDILIFDEPTSNVDGITERSILSTLPAFVKNKTLFVVANRLSTIMDSDYILLLDENRFVDIGSHKSLLETNEYYRRLISCQ